MAAKAKAFCHIEKNLKALEQFPRVALNNIRDFQEAFKPVCCFHLFLDYCERICYCTDEFTINFTCVVLIIIFLCGISHPRKIGFTVF